MKRLLLLTLLCCATALSCLADSWTDGEGVTWYFSVSGTNATIYGATNYGKTLTLPIYVYNGTTAYKVTCLRPYYPSSYNYYFHGDFEDLVINSPDTVGYSTYNYSGMVSRAVTVHVPSELISLYKGMDCWKNVSRQIIPIGAQTDYDITVTAQDNSSSFYNAIGEDNLDNVETLKVTGTINGHDISYFRNKMYNLHHLDLSDANIVANDFEYYKGYHTEDNTLGGCAFRQLANLISVKLPKTLKGKIGNNAFSSCYYLKDVTIPDSITSIGREAFYCCYALENVKLPDKLQSIESTAFYFCSNILDVTLPDNLRYIGQQAFDGTKLTSVILPESLETIDGSAFAISTLVDVYTTRFSPLNIPDDAFSNAAKCRLWAPYKKAADGEKADWNAVYMAYYDHAQWGKFMSVNQWPDYVYKKISLGEDEDFEQDQGSAPTTDSTAAEFDNKSGFINNSEDTQKLDTITVHGDGTDAAAIIADGNIDANGLKFDLQVKANRWYFFCFPFDIRLSDITCGGHYVWRYYDGSKRALGQSGWCDLPDDETTLHAWKGYIFQTDTPGRLLLNVLKSAFKKFEGDDRRPEIESHQADNVEDASWNFMGNPWTSYFNIGDMDYTSPITYWDGSNYQTVRPGDDDYTLHPFEAFFVQKPDDVDGINFGHEHRYTKNGSGQREANAKAHRLMKGINPNRLFANLTLSDGKTTDRTRVVYNNSTKATYEIGTDAAKFATQGVVNLYTIDAQGHRYAINERPVGEVKLAYSAPKAGELTIAADRMDTPLLLKDNTTGTTFDLANGGYTFETEAGTFESRFIIVQNSNATGIADIQTKTGVSVIADDGGMHFNGIDAANVGIYTLGGAQMTSNVRNGFVSLPRGTYVVSVNGMTTKVIVK